MIAGTHNSVHVLGTVWRYVTTGEEKNEMKLNRVGVSTMSDSRQGWRLIPIMGWRGRWWSGMCFFGGTINAFITSSARSRRKARQGPNGA